MEERNFGLLLLNILKRDPELKEVTIELKEVQRNNGTKFLTLMFKQNESHVASATQLSKYLEAYKSKHMSIEAIIYDIKNLIVNYSEHERFFAQMTSFENVKDFIGFRLINYKTNEEKLEKVVHAKYLDLAVEFILVLDKVHGIISITQDMLDVWGTTVQEVSKIAKVNMPKLCPATLGTMKETLIQRAESEDEKEMIRQNWEEAFDNMPFWILSNEIGQYGAGVALYKDVLALCADKFNSDLILLPCSVHEWIVLPEAPEVNYSDFIPVVRMVNATEVSEEEYLSDNVYKYTRFTDTLEIMKE